MQNRSFTAFLALLLGALACALSAAATPDDLAHPAKVDAAESPKPSTDATQSPDARAEAVLSQLTLDEKISLLHGNGMFGVERWQMPLTALTNGGAGYVEGIPRLGIPAIVISDAAYGVRSSGQSGRYSTALPSCLGAAATWDPEAAYAYGSLIGRELKALGFNMSLGGGTNLTREPRDGRTFEYLGEDPILAGTMVGNLLKGLQAQHVLGNVKHYAMNDQETGRNFVNAIISKRAMQESDLLAFHIGLRISDAGAVMCSYNRINGDYGCENSYLLNSVLKNDWKFKGFVISDWGGTHSTVKASAAGLDNEQPMADFFGPALKAAVVAGQVPVSEIDEHVRRILRSEFAIGIVDNPIEKSVVDVPTGLEMAQQFEEQSIVLLRNDGGILPLDGKKLQRVAVIGGHADVGMVSGGGSAQVDPPGGNAIAPPGKGATTWQAHIWFPTSPLKALRAKLPNAQVEFNSGQNPEAAVALARNSDVAIVFAYQWESEDMDLPTLALPDSQDVLIEQVAAANPHTIVVLESGGPVLMPWAGKVSGIVEAWYAGSSGHIAVANVLLGDVNPTAKLAVTFPRSDQDLPHPTIATVPLVEPDKPVARDALPAYSVTYDEGLKVGYKWYDAEHKPVLFPFGFGLSYTTYRYSNLKVDPAARQVSFTVTNTGNRAGAEIAQVYVSLPAAANEPPKRLVGWTKPKLSPGQSREVIVDIDPQYLQIFDEPSNAFKLLPGQYTFAVGGSSQDLGLKQEVALK
ncbi:MAG TPA: glycoside hydrolase family 3 C-terminal domain-containing protein [Candidatus Dormibacteraeota bacterium]|nr:glycoside hydrolase family 3 C-terminal domain-containing protein [Candidatus Dormibacteraeota bacterium]